MTTNRETKVMVIKADDLQNQIGKFNGFCPVDVLADKGQRFYHVWNEMFEQQCEFLSIDMQAELYFNASESSSRSGNKGDTRRAKWIIGSSAKGGSRLRIGLSAKCLYQRRHLGSSINDFLIPPEFEIALVCLQSGQFLSPG